MIWGRQEVVLPTGFHSQSPSGATPEAHLEKVIGSNSSESLSPQCDTSRFHVHTERTTLSFGLERSTSTIFARA